jgi:histidinol-phosphate aminotransferase
VRPEDSILDWVQPHLREMPGYARIEPPEILAERLGLPVERIIKLDGNENPYGASPKALRALATATHYNVYPDPLQRRLRQALSEYVGVEPEWVAAGAGSDELIDVVTRMFVAPKEAILNFPPTFGMYAFFAEAQGARVIDLPRRPDFALKLDGLAEVAKKARLIFVVSPNNPTGNTLSRRELQALLDTGRPVVVDEAYAEFAGETFVPLVRERANLMVLRTLSKWAGLAGLRIGYMVARPEVVEIALKIKQPYGVSVAAEVAAIASIEDREHLMGTVAAIVAERERLRKALASFEGFSVAPSAANFLLCRLVGLDAKALHAALRGRGILVRYFDTPLLRNYVRISVGKPEHTDALVEALTEVVGDIERGERVAL